MPLTVCFVIRFFEEQQYVLFKSIHPVLKYNKSFSNIEFNLSEKNCLSPHKEPITAKQPVGGIIL